MATTISSGRANSPKKLANIADHGVIYGGRGLVFDGVSDYLTLDKLNIGGTSGTTTISAWVKTDDAGVTQNIFANTYDGSNRIALQVKGDEAIIGQHSGSSKSGTILDNTWTHLVGTIDDGTYSLYINGEAQTGTTAISSASSTQVARIGSRADSSTELFNGDISNLQIWDKVWSLTDAQYAYTHPEKLITDNSSVTSGTTISNLKAWYPCTEGNPRSPQTTVYDGSPKELGSELIGDGGFESGTDSWNYTNTTISQSTDYVKSGTYSLKVVQSGGSSDRAYKTFTTVIGKTYKFSFDTYKPSSGQDVAYIMRVATGSDHGTPVSETISTLDAWVNTTGYVTATQTTFYIVAIPHDDSAGDDTVYIDNVSVKLVNGNPGLMTNMASDDIVKDTP